MGLRVRCVCSAKTSVVVLSGDFFGPPRGWSKLEKGLVTDEEDLSCIDLNAFESVCKSQLAL
jgi:BRCT domain type II-containing protein